MDYNTPSARESLTRADAFGEKLERDGNFHLTSPFTYLYNCIAYAVVQHIGIEQDVVDRPAEGGLQLPAHLVGDGVYHSKFGASYNGTHSNGDVLQAQYGKPFVIMRRPKTEAHLTDDRKGTAPGVIHTNFKVDINGQYDHIVAFGGKTYLGEHGHEVRIVGGIVQLV